MLYIYCANDVFTKTEFNTETDYAIYPAAEFGCGNCKEKVSVALKDLDRHRFSRFSNLSEEHQNLFDIAALSFMPQSHINAQRQHLFLNKTDRIKIWIQRVVLTLSSQPVKFLQLPKTGDYLPDSFLDFYCPQCGKPIRVYYSSYLGGRQGEHGYILMYLVFED
jgi:hypothetical protein